MAAVGFVTWDGGGNVEPALGIAAELHRRGHAVRVLGQPQQEAAVAGRGLRFEGLGEAAWRADSDKNGTLGMARAFGEVARGRTAAGLDAALRREPVDLLVVDALLQTLARDRPGLLLQHSFAVPSPLARLRGRRLYRGAPPVLAATLPELDPDSARFPELTYVGPVWQGDPRPATPERPRVLVSLSTVWFPRLRRTLQTVLDGLDGLSAEVVVTAPESVDRATLRVPAGIAVRGYVPHAELLPTVSLVVGHGGHATTMAALAHDLPLVVIPMHAVMDQTAVGRAVARAGAGRLLGTAPTAAAVRGAVEDLLVDGPHRAAAARLGAAIRRRDGAVEAADVLERALREPD